MVSQVHRVVASTHHYQKKNNENTPLPVIKSTQKKKGPIISFVKEAPRIRNLRKNKNWVSFYFIYMLRKTIANKLNFKHNYLPLSVINCFIKWHVWKKEYVCGLLPARKKIKIRPPARPPAQPRPPQTSSSSLWPSSCAAPTPPPFHLARQWTQAEESSDPLSSPSSPSPLLSSHPTPPHLSQGIQRRKTSQKKSPTKTKTPHPPFWVTSPLRGFKELLS